MQTIQILGYVVGGFVAGLLVMGTISWLFSSPELPAADGMTSHEYWMRREVYKKGHVL